jgi:hypothetical protein
MGKRLKVQMGERTKTERYIANQIPRFLHQREAELG